MNPSMSFSDSRAEILEAKQQAEAADTSLQKTLQRLEDYSVKLKEAWSAVSSANDSVRSSSEMLRDSEDTSEFLYFT